MSNWLEQVLALHVSDPKEATLELRLHHYRVSDEEIVQLTALASQYSAMASQLAASQRADAAAANERIASYNAQLASMGGSTLDYQSGVANNPYMNSAAAYSWAATLLQHHGEPPFPESSRTLAVEILQKKRPVQDGVALMSQGNPEAAAYQGIAKMALGYLDSMGDLLNPLARLLGGSTPSLTERLVMPWVVAAVPRTELYKWTVQRASSEQRLAALRKAFDGALGHAQWLAFRGDPAALEHLRHALMIAEQTPETDDDVAALQLRLRILQATGDHAALKSVMAKSRAIAEAPDPAPGLLEVVAEVEQLASDGAVPALAQEARALAKEARSRAESLLRGKGLSRERWGQMALACAVFDSSHDEGKRARQLLEAYARDLGDRSPEYQRAKQLVEGASRGPRTVETADASTGGETETIAQLLAERLQRDIDAGKVDPSKGRTLEAVLGRLQGITERAPETVADHLAIREEMKEATESFADTTRYLSVGIDPPRPETRAGRLDEMLWRLRRWLMVEGTNQAQSHAEKAKASELYLRVSEVTKRIYEAGDDDQQAIALDQQAIRPLAREVRQFSLRHHLLLARPIWGTARVSVDASALFFSGPRERREQVERVCSAIGLESLAAPTAGDFARARWQQLREANIAVFDLDGEDGPSKAAVAYELGIARTLGKPVVLLTRGEHPLPFDVDVTPVVASCEGADDAIVTEGVDEALVWRLTRPSKGSVAETIEEALRRYGDQGGDVIVRGSLQQLRAMESGTETDATVVAATLGALLDYVEGDRSMVVRSRWRPTYPKTEGARVFHVMPFQPKSWGDEVSAAVEAACRARGADYQRGDRAREQHVIESIWEEINRATHLLVDLTRFNANVALELGIAHTLGRPTVMVGQGDTVDRLFPMIAKLRFYSYTEPRDEALAGHVGMLVEES